MNSTVPVPSSALYSSPSHSNQRRYSSPRGFSRTQLLQPQPHSQSHSLHGVAPSFLRSRISSPTNASHRRHSPATPPNSPTNFSKSPKPRTSLISKRCQRFIFGSDDSHKFVDPAISPSRLRIRLNFQALRSTPLSPPPWASASAAKHLSGSVVFSFPTSIWNQRNRMEIRNWNNSTALSAI